MTKVSQRVIEKLPKLSPEQVEQLLGSLTGEKEMEDAILESLSTGLLVCDENGYIMQSNKAAERYVVFVRPPMDPRNSGVPIWEVVGNEEIAAFLNTLWEQQRTNVSADFTVTTAGGTRRYIMVSVVPLIRRHRMTGNIVKIDDMTEKSNREILLRRMESLANLTNMAATVAHEIKNPLGSISIHIQLMQKAIVKARAGDGTLPDPKFIENYLTVVTEEIDRLNQIIVDFLFAVRPLNAEPVFTNPDRLLKKDIDFFRPEFDEKHIEVIEKLSGSCPDIFLDEKLFRQVIFNLVKNAIAAMPNGGTMTFSSCLKDDHYTLSMADTGCGMDSQTLSRIFEPYFTTKADGTGLGLTMVYKIIKELSGDIDVKSAVGEGTKFVISFPVPQRERRLIGYEDDREVKKTV
jgi:signal transduction histidine kinase